MKDRENKDLTYIREQFDADGLQAPDSLSRDAVREKLLREMRGSLEAGSDRSGSELAKNEVGSDRRGSESAKNEIGSDRSGLELVKNREGMTVSEEKKYDSGEKKYDLEEKKKAWQNTDGGSGVGRNGSGKKGYVWGGIGAAAACAVAALLIGSAVTHLNLGMPGSTLQDGIVADSGANGDAGESGLAGAAGESGLAGAAGDSEAAGAAGQKTEVGSIDETTGMTVFSDYAELEQRVSQLVPEEEEVYDYDDGGMLGFSFGSGAAAGRSDTAVANEEATGVMEDADIAATDSAAPDVAEIAGSAAPKAAASSAGEAGDSSSTYAQVKGVDEADIIKTDDKYIYYLDEYMDEIKIVEASKGATKEVSSIRIDENLPVVNDFYLYQDKLVLLSTEWNDKNGRSTTMAQIYDISDRTAPKMENEYKQSGTLISSRMVGEYLYLVSDYDFYSYGDGRYIPYVTTENGYEKMSIRDICAFPGGNRADYVIAGSLDVTSGKKLKTKAKAVLGGFEQIYCNTENLYIAGYHYNWDEPYYLDEDVIDYAEEDVLTYGNEDDAAEATEEDALAKDAAEGPAEDTLAEGTEAGTTGGASQDKYLQDDEEGTVLLKASFKDGAIRFTAGGSVKGMVNNQFSMDEKDGYFRIATTSQSNHGYDVNNLFVLDENLNQVGEVTGIAKGEHIEAVRFIGKKAYMITYEQTDPLFVIDLSDPKNPKVEGSVKIEGFSTLLVPAEENYLLGIGYATETTSFGEAQDGLKLVVFDISDPSHPRVADTKEMIHAESEVQYNHKALVQNVKKNYFAIPYNQYDEEYRFEHGGVLTVRVENGKLKVLKDLKKKAEEIRRCVYIDDYIYGVYEDDWIYSWQMR